MRKMKNKRYITVVFDDEVPLLQAVHIIQENDQSILDVLTPFPVHGLDKALKMKRTRIPIAGFICGAIGGLFGFLAQSWIFAVDYPLVFGGKPYLSVPSFIPVTFELTVLFTAIGVVSALFIRSRFIPRKKFEPIHDRITDDRFVILVDAAENEESTRSSLQSALSGISNVEIV
jgi:hypothetical protein